MLAGVFVEKKLISSSIICLLLDKSFLRLQN